MPHPRNISSPAAQPRKYLTDKEAGRENEENMKGRGGREMAREMRMAGSS